MTTLICVREFLSDLSDLGVKWPLQAAIGELAAELDAKDTAFHLFWKR